MEVAWPSLGEMLPIWLMVWGDMLKLFWPYLAVLIGVRVLLAVLQRALYRRRRYRGQRYLVVELDEE